MVKRKAVAEKAHVNAEEPKRSKAADSVIQSSTSQKFYSDYNIKTILAHYLKDRALDLDVEIIARDNSGTQEEQWQEQEARYIKKLKIDLDKFASKSLQEKFYIIGIKESANQITSAAIIRCFVQNEEVKVSIIPLINYAYSSQYNGSLNSDNMIMEYMDDFPNKRSCGALIKKEAVVFSQLIEILRTKIQGILDESSTVEENIQRILQEAKNAEDNISVHKEILAQYPSGEHNSGDIEKEEEEFNILEDKTEEKKNVGFAAKSKNPISKKASWSSAVIENEMGSYRVNDKEAIEIFAKALNNWDAELFKEAKGKSVDFHGLVNYFDNEIKLGFWSHFHRNFAYKLAILEETDPLKKSAQQKEYDEFIAKIADGYNFFMDNIPAFLDRMQIEQDATIMSLPEDRKRHEAVDFIKIIENDIRNNAIITEVMNSIEISALESNAHATDLIVVESEAQKDSDYSTETIEELIALIIEKPSISPEEGILRHSLLFNKHLLKDFKSSDNTDASINALFISESANILKSMTGIHLVKENQTGATFIQRYQTVKPIIHAQSISETGLVKIIEHTEITIAGVSILNEKLRAQVSHYLETGEAFDSMRSAMENGAIRMITQPSIAYEETVIPTQSTVHTYNESPNDSSEGLDLTAALSIEMHAGGLASQLFHMSQ